MSTEDEAMPLYQSKKCERVGVERSSKQNEQ